jgi:hypothetical protein
VVADAAPTPEAETARSSRQIFILDPAASGNLNVFYPWAPIQVSWVSFLRWW